MSIAQEYGWASFQSDRVYHEDMLFTVIDYTLKVVITKCDDGAIFQTMPFPTSLMSFHTAAGSRKK
jgi:hypothetical protein